MPGRTLRSDRSERGAATALATGLCGVLLTLGAVLGVIAAVVVDLRTAQAAADLGALAGAVAVGRGDDGCASSAQVAAANGATLTSCAVDGREVKVSVVVRGPRWLGLAADPTAQARAGPVGVADDLGARAAVTLGQ